MTITNEGLILAAFVLAGVSGDDPDNAVEAARELAAHLKGEKKMDFSDIELSEEEDPRMIFYKTLQESVSDTANDLPGLHCADTDDRQEVLLMMLVAELRELNQYTAELSNLLEERTRTA